MSYSYDIKWHTRELERRIRHMTNEELYKLYQEVRNDSYMLRRHSSECAIILDEVVRVQRERKGDELRDALILFFRSNAHLGKSLESVAENIADASVRAGGSLSSSVGDIAAIIQQARDDVSSSDLPKLISEMHEAIERRDAIPKRLR